jgi:hypothetical protein
LLRRYHQPLALIDSEHVITQETQGPALPKDARPNAAPSGNGVAKPGPSKSARGTRSKRKNKRGT